MSVFRASFFFVYSKYRNVLPSAYCIRWFHPFYGLEIEFRFYFYQNYFEIQTHTLSNYVESSRASVYGNIVGTFVCTNISTRTYICRKKYMAQFVFFFILDYESFNSVCIHYLMVILYG